jgi:hypothetical protein
VIELSFHRELYSGEAVDEAAKMFEPYATIERSAEEHRWVVRVTAAEPSREHRVARELANFALGVTIERASGARPS